MLVKIPSAVALAFLLGACARPAKDHPAGAADPALPTSASANTEAIAAAAVAPSVPPPSPATADATTAGAVPASSATGPQAASSAYFGCGEPIPPAHLWDETTEGEVLDAISSAKSCAAKHGRRLLLEFVAPWCEDCREMARLDENELVAATLKKRFERVRVNVGKWDRHEGLRNSFDVHALATYIVIDPKSSKQLAKTTLEPVTKKGQKLSAEQWARWLDAH